MKVVNTRARRLAQTSLDGILVGKSPYGVLLGRTRRDKEIGQHLESQKDFVESYAPAPGLDQAQASIAWLSNNPEAAAQYGAPFGAAAPTVSLPEMLLQAAGIQNISEFVFE